MDQRQLYCSHRSANVKHGTDTAKHPLTYILPRWDETYCVLMAIYGLYRKVHMIYGGWRCCNCLYISTNHNRNGHFVYKNIVPTFWYPLSYLQINCYIYVPSTVRIQTQDFIVSTSTQSFTLKQKRCLYKWPMALWCNSWVKGFWVWTGDFPCGVSMLFPCLWGFFQCPPWVPTGAL